LKAANCNTEHKLKNAKLKITYPRTAVLDILDNSELPVTADDIFLKMKTNPTLVNFSTVYRTLETLSEKGIINRFYIDGEKRALYESVRDKHRHYLICIGCHKILPLDCCPLSAYQKQLEKEAHYSIVSHMLILYGYCPQCKADS